MAEYGFKLTSLTEIPSDTPSIVLTLVRGETTITKTLMRYENPPLVVWIDDLENPSAFITPELESGEYYELIITSFDETNVGDEYTINLSLPEEPTQAFENAMLTSHYPFYNNVTLFYTGSVEVPSTQGVSYANFPNSYTTPPDEWKVKINGVDATFYSHSRGEYTFIIQDSDYIRFFVETDDSSEIFGNSLFVNESLVPNTFAIEIATESSGISSTFADAVHMVVGGGGAKTIIYVSQSDLMNYSSGNVNGYKDEAMTTQFASGEITEESDLVVYCVYNDEITTTIVPFMNVLAAGGNPGICYVLVPGQNGVSAIPVEYYDGK